jgi:transcriptional regulator with XRE-family HTH domain
VILSEQIRAARALLGWEQKTLADEAGLGLSTIKRLESARGPVGGTAESVWAVQEALEKAGIIFIDGDDRAGPGVRLAAPTRGRAG